MFADVEHRISTTQVLYGQRPDWEIDLENKRPTARPVSSTTSFSRADAEFDLFNDSSMTGGAVSSDAGLRLGATVGRTVPDAKTAKDVQISEVASERVILMAANYAGTSGSKELLARLAILDQRLIALDPPIKLAQIEKLEHVAELAADLAERRRQRAIRLSL